MAAGKTKGAAELPEPAVAPTTAPETISPPPAAAPAATPPAAAPAPRKWTGPPNFTACRVVTTGSVLAQGYDINGRTRQSFNGGDVAWFADADVLSLPDILIPE